MITKKELLQMLSDTESYNIERTESTGNMDKFCQAICTFSNDMSRGKNSYLIICAKDNGKLPGLQVDDKLLLSKVQYLHFELHFRRVSAAQLH